MGRCSPLTVRAVRLTWAKFSTVSKVQSMMPLVVTLRACAWAAISSADRRRRLQARGRWAGSSSEIIVPAASHCSQCCNRTADISPCHAAAVLSMPAGAPHLAPASPDGRAAAATMAAAATTYTTYADAEVGHGRERSNRQCGRTGIAVHGGREAGAAACLSTHQSDQSDGAHG